MRVIIDRFEGNFAVVELEDGTMVNMPKILVPNANEGDTVTIESYRDTEREKRIKKLADELFK